MGDCTYARGNGTAGFEGIFRIDRMCGWHPCTVLSCLLTCIISLMLHSSPLLSVGNDYSESTIVSLVRWPDIVFTDHSLANANIASLLIAFLERRLNSTLPTNSREALSQQCPLLWYYSTIWYIIASLNRLPPPCILFNMCHKMTRRDRYFGLQTVFSVGSMACLR